MLLVDDGELIHRLLAIPASPALVRRDVSQSQPDQLGYNIITGEVFTHLGGFAQSSIDALDGFGSKDHPPDGERAGPRLLVLPQTSATNHTNLFS
jgi:hypothetical protein